MDASYIPVAKARGFTTHWINAICRFDLSQCRTAPDHVFLRRIIIHKIANDQYNIRILCFNGLHMFRKTFSMKCRSCM